MFTWSLFIIFRSRSGYDSSSGGESDNEYSTVSQGSQVQSQAQNQLPSVTNYGQGKHINKGRWTKDEVNHIFFLFNYFFNYLIPISFSQHNFLFFSKDN